MTKRHKIRMFFNKSVKKINHSFFNIKEEMVKKYKQSPSQIEFFYSSIPFRLFWRLIFSKQAHTICHKRYKCDKFISDLYHKGAQNQLSTLDIWSVAPLAIIPTPYKYLSFFLFSTQNEQFHEYIFNLLKHGQFPPTGNLEDTDIGIYSTTHKYFSTSWSDFYS